MGLHAVVIILGLIEMLYVKNLSEGSEIFVKLYLSP